MSLRSKVQKRGMNGEKWRRLAERFSMELSGRSVVEKEAKELDPAKGEDLKEENGSNLK